MSDLQRYPYNPDGTLADCQIIDEQQVLTTINSAEYQMLIPLAAPFFQKNLKVVHKADNRWLQEGVDFQLTHKFRAAKRELKENIYGSITFLDRQLSGSISLSYSTLGGDFVVKDIPVLNRLVSDLTQHRSVDWEDIVNVPPVFPPTYHRHDDKDVLAMDDVVIALEDIKAVLTGELTPEHHHPMENITGLTEALANKVSNVDYGQYLPMSPVRITEKCQTVALSLPRPKTTTGLSLQLTLLKASASQTVTATGWIAPEGDDLTDWLALSGHVENAFLADVISGSYTRSGVPVLYIQSTEDFFNDCTFLLEQIVYTERVSENLNGHYTLEVASGGNGAPKPLSRYIDYQLYTEMMTRLDRVKLNTLLEEVIFPII